MKLRYAMFKEYVLSILKQYDRDCICIWNNYMWGTSDIKISFAIGSKTTVQIPSIVIEDRTIIESIEDFFKTKGIEHPLKHMWDHIYVWEENGKIITQFRCGTPIQSIRGRNTELIEL